MIVKVIALKKIHKTEIGGSLSVASTVATALVRMGSARLASPDERDEPAPRRRGRLRNQQEAAE